jgi:hypothetical protein
MVFRRCSVAGGLYSHTSPHSPVSGSPIFDSDSASPTPVTPDALAAAHGLPPAFAVGLCAITSRVPLWVLLLCAFNAHTHTHAHTVSLSLSLIYWQFFKDATLAADIERDRGETGTDDSPLHLFWLAASACNTVVPTCDVLDGESDCGLQDTLLIDRGGGLLLRGIPVLIGLIQSV